LADFPAVLQEGGREGGASICLHTTCDASAGEGGASTPGLNGYICLRPVQGKFTERGRKEGGIFAPA